MENSLTGCATPTSTHQDTLSYRRTDKNGKRTEANDDMRACIEEMVWRGFANAGHAELLDCHGIVARIRSIELNRGVGYNLATAYQVLNAIMQSGHRNTDDLSLYFMAFSLIFRRFSFGHGTLFLVLFRIYLFFRSLVLSLLLSFCFTSIYLPVATGWQTQLATGGWELWSRSAWLGYQAWSAMNFQHS